MPSLTPPRPSSPAWSTSATCGHCAPDPEDLALLPLLSPIAPTAPTSRKPTPPETAWSTSATCGSGASSRTITPVAASFDIFETAPVPLRRKPKFLRGSGGARAVSRGDVEVESESESGESQFGIWLVYAEFLKGGDGAEGEEVQGEGKGKEKAEEEKGEKVGELHVKWKADLPTATRERSKSADSGVAEGGLECKGGEPASGIAVEGGGIRRTKRIAAVDANRMCRSIL